MTRRQANLRLVLVGIAFALVAFLVTRDVLATGLLSGIVLATGLLAIALGGRRRMPEDPPPRD